MTYADAIRRARALAALGHTPADLARAGRIPTAVVADILAGDEAAAFNWRPAVIALYDRLHMTPGPAPEYGKRMRETSGWAPPLAWDNIDDPAEVAHGYRGERGNKECTVGGCTRPRDNKGARKCSAHNKGREPKTFVDLDELAFLLGTGESLDHAVRRVAPTSNDPENAVERAVHRHPEHPVRARYAALRQARADATEADRLRLATEAARWTHAGSGGGTPFGQAAA